MAGIHSQLNSKRLLGITVPCVRNQPSELVPPPRGGCPAGSTGQHVDSNALHDGLKSARILPDLSAAVSPVGSAQVVPYLFPVAHHRLAG